MADNAKRYGFRWATSNSHPCPKPVAIPVANLQAFTPDAATAAKLQPGDPVKILNGGGLDHADEGGTVPTSNVYGIMVALGHDGKVFNNSFSSNGVLHPSSFIPSGVNYGTNLENQTIALVVPATGVFWEIDSDATLADLAAWQALVGLNADHSYDAPAGSDLDANPRLATATAGTASAQWRIERVSPTSLNQDFSGANVKLIVSINETQESPYTVVGPV